MTGRRAVIADRIDRALIGSLRSTGPGTLAELMNRTGWSRPLVTAHLESLLSAGTVGVIDDQRSTGGRPARRYSLSEARRVVVGIEIDGARARVTIGDLGGRMLTDSETLGPHSRGLEQFVTILPAAVDTLLSAVRRTKVDVGAVGVGVHGHGIDRGSIERRVADVLGTTVLVDRAVNLAALEYRRGFGRLADDLIVVDVGEHIASAALSGGRPLRRAGGLAGDIAHMKSTGGTEPCCCGAAGCIESVASGAAVLRHLRRSGATVSSFDDLVRLERRGDLDTIRAVKQAGREIGDVLVTGIRLLNPSMVLLQGALVRTGGYLINGVGESLSSTSGRQASGVLLLVSDDSGRDAVLGGAVALAVDHVLSLESADATAAQPGRGGSFGRGREVERPGSVDFELDGS